MILTKEFYMNKALIQAYKAQMLDEVPVGAIIVYQDVIIASAFNQREKKKKATAHAELSCIEKANKIFGDWRLTNCDLYVTLEPCPMCIGAAINARIANIYFGAFDLQSGCCGSKINIAQLNLCNHTPHIEGGILENECKSMLQNYFKKIRK
ncbi:MAG: nucleoside deaminase [Clostridia bacterium]